MSFLLECPHAYYLGKLGVKNVAVLERSYMGSGAADRNTTILRSNYKTPEGARFYDQSVRMYERLSAELDFNLLFSVRAPDPGALRSGDVRDGQPG
jgi:sarcosine oxidase, subunit beta